MYTHYRERERARGSAMFISSEDAERRCEEDGARTPEVLLLLLLIIIIILLLTQFDDDNNDNYNHSKKGACGLHNTAVLMGCDGSDDDGRPINKSTKKSLHDIYIYIYTHIIEYYTILYHIMI